MDLDKNLLAKLKKPQLWQRSQIPFWDDEHISKGMLEAHLNPDTDAASRKTDSINRSVSWLSTLIPTGSKILDLGCGPGLYASRLSNLGYQTTAIDYSKRSIAYAKKQDEKTNYIYQDYLTLDYEEEFDAIILIYCDYGALTKAERMQLLSKIKRALKPGGLFIVDAFTRLHHEGEEDHTSWYTCEENNFWSEDACVCLEAGYFYENRSVAVDQYVIVTEKEVCEYLVWNTDFDQESFTKEMEEAGLLVKNVYDDVCGKSFTGQEETICLVATK